MIITREDLSVSYEMMVHAHLDGKMGGGTNLVDNWMGYATWLAAFAEVAERAKALGEFRYDYDPLLTVTAQHAVLTLHQSTIDALVAQEGIPFDNWCATYGVMRSWTVIIGDDEGNDWPESACDYIEDADAGWKSLQEPATMTMDEALAIGDLETVLENMPKPDTEEAFLARQAALPQAERDRQLGQEIREEAEREAALG